MTKILLITTVNKKLALINANKGNKSCKQVSSCYFQYGSDLASPNQIHTEFNRRSPNEPKTKLKVC